MVDIDINTVCNVCGKDVEADYIQGDIIITPCRGCLDERYEDGRHDGIDEAS